MNNERLKIMGIKDFNRIRIRTGYHDMRRKKGQRGKSREENYSFAWLIREVSDTSNDRN